MRVIIAGGREFDSYEKLEEVVNSLFKKNEISQIVSGTARGADRLGERYAKEHNIKVAQFPADWDQHGKSAGYKRNKLMAENADVLVAFWDGESKGTDHMIKIAKEKGLKVHISYYHKRK